MNLLDFISIFVAIATLLLGFFVWLKGKRKKVNIWFFLLTIAVAGWVGINWVTYYLLNYNLINFFGGLLYAFSSIIVPIFFQFVYYFPSQETLSNSRIIKYGLLVSWLFGFVLAVLSLFTHYVEESPIIIRPHLATVAHGVLHPYFFIFFILFIVWGFAILMNKYRRLNSGIERQKIKFLIFGLATTAFFGIVANLILETFILNIAVRATASMIGPLFTIVMVASTSYAILRYRLMDIKVVIRKGVVHFISIVIVLFLYLYLLFFMQKYFVDTYHWNNQTSILVLVAIIALTIEPLRRFLFKVVDKVFYAKRKNVREEGKKLRFILSSSLQFDQLIEKIKVALQSFLDVQATQFLWNNKQNGWLENYYPKDRQMRFTTTDPLFHYLQEHPDILITEETPYMAEEASGAEQEILRQIEQTLKKLNIGLVYPVGEGGELVGAFLFSPKLKKEAFTSDNVEYLSGLQTQLTGAIMNALLYKQAVERITKLK
jgi:hypothetical protein